MLDTYVSVPEVEAETNATTRNEDLALVIDLGWLAVSWGGCRARLQMTDVSD